MNTSTKPDDRPLRPYNADPISPRLVATKWHRTRLNSGAEISVGKQHGHPHGGGDAFVCDLRHTQPSGERTRLVFCITPEGAGALIALFRSHGIRLEASPSSPPIGPRPERSEGSTP